MKAITVRQPWAWLLFHGKPVENRDWYTAYRGLLAIHAAQGMTRDEYEDARDFVRTFDPALACRIPDPESLERGAVLGTVNQIGCVKQYESPWFQGRFGHLYESPKLLAVPELARGALGLWEWRVPDGGLRYADAPLAPVHERTGSLVSCTIPERVK
ncbi:MAG TPA: ASCH domain-containing protein [Candidatus Limnocylindrales bacterium]|nr:ASCH domain-containing protein [Candidatus Limnocylindrales bacterium]